MRISKHGIAAFGTALLAALAVSGCSPAVQTGSDVPGLSLVALSDLPRSPESGAVVEAYCEAYQAKDLTATGRAVEARGWKVTSEAALGRYRVVSFVSGFDPGTSGICTARNGNIGVFDGTRLVALAYAPGGSDLAPGPVEALESGALLVWDGGYPAPPLGELRLERDQPRLTPVGPERTFCRRTATVPTVYGQPIETARKTLIARGWRPLPPEAAPGEYDGASELAGRGVIEAEGCSGTGMGFCAFKYQGVGGVLGVTTAGEDHQVVSYGVTCPGD
jgi:hypothetical protein